MKRRLLLLVPALFIRAIRLRWQNDIGAFKHRAWRFIAEQLHLHLYACFTSTRQTVEIAAQCAQVSNRARLAADRGAVADMGIGQNNGAAEMTFAQHQPDQSPAGERGE